MKKRDQINNMIDDDIRDILTIKLGSNFRNQMFSRIYKKVSNKADLLLMVYYCISVQKAKND